MSHDAYACAQNAHAIHKCVILKYISVITSASLVIHLESQTNMSSEESDTMV